MRVVDVDVPAIGRTILQCVFTAIAGVFVVGHSTVKISRGCSGDDTGQGQCEENGLEREHDVLDERDDLCVVWSVRTVR